MTIARQRPQRSCAGTLRPVAAHDWPTRCLERTTRIRSDPYVTIASQPTTLQASVATCSPRTARELIVRSLDNEGGGILLLGAEFGRHVGIHMELHGVCAGNGDTRRTPSVGEEHGHMRRAVPQFFPRRREADGPG